MTTAFATGTAHHTRTDQTRLRFLAAPTEADPATGNIRAGHVLEWIDRAGFACAAGWSGSYCVTAYVGNVHFARPVHAGDLIDARARIVGTGRTTMQILVTVAAADPRVGDFTPATHCLLVFVAVDADRRPTAVPTWEARSLADLDLNDRIERRIEMRGRIADAMSAEQYTAEGTAPRTVFRFLAQPTDVNWGGSVHGGTVLRWLDDAAATCAASWTHRPMVAVYAGGIHFHRPIPIGNLVEVEARLIHTGAHSVHVAIAVRSADPTLLEWATTTRCMSIYVSPGPDGRAEPVEPLHLVSGEDRRLDAHALHLIALRSELDAIGAEDMPD